MASSNQRNGGSSMISQHLRSNAVAYAALFVAMSGTAVAAVEPDSVVSASIVDGEVKNADLGSNAVRGGKVLDNSLSGADVLDGSLNGADLADGSIGSAKVADFSLTAQDVGINALSGGNIAEDSLLQNDIGTSAIGAPELRSSSVQASEIDIDAVGAAEIASSGVGADEIAANGVGAAEIATGAVGSLDVADGGLGNADLGSNAADARVVAVDAVGVNEIGPLPAVRAARKTGNDFDVTPGLRWTVPLTGEWFDTAGLHSNSTDPEDLIAPVDGIYQISGGVNWDQFAGNGYTEMSIDAPGGGGTSTWHDGRPGYQSASTLAALEAGDLVRLSVFTTTDANLIGQGYDAAHLEMVWVSEI